MNTTTNSDLAIPPILNPYQQQAANFIINHPFAGIWINIGGGKTLTTLTALQHIRPVGHILVIAPIAIARSTWINEITQWNFPIRTQSLIVNDHDKKLTRKQRLERYQKVFTDPPTMYFINQDLIVDLVAEMSNQDQSLKTKNLMKWPFQTIIIDESQEFKSHSSQRFKALKIIRPYIHRLIALTGTPAPNGLMDLWSQVYLLDQGQALGKNITAYRNRWFTPEMIPGSSIPAKWKPNSGAEQEIHQTISHLVMSTQNTPVSLPPLTIKDIHVHLSPDLIQSYQIFKKNLVIHFVNETNLQKAKKSFDSWIGNSTDPEATHIRQELSVLKDNDWIKKYKNIYEKTIHRFTQEPDAEIFNTVIAQNAAAMVNKLRQFASGTLYSSDSDDPQTKGQYQIIHDAKIQQVISLLQRHQTEPVLIAYHFTSDKHQILLRLRQAGFNPEGFDGSRTMVSRWNAQEIPIMLIHPASAGAGLNLQHGGSVLIWFTLPYSLKHYQQTNGRLYRTGQNKPVTIYQIITKHTEDERIPRLLLNKKQIQSRLIDAVDIEKIFND